MRPVAVYRVFDAYGRLLYVGRSTNPLLRMGDHAKRAWTTQIARIEATWFDEIDAAAEEERRAIASERPMWNIHHKAGPRFRDRGIYHSEFRRDDPLTWIQRVFA